MIRAAAQRLLAVAEDRLPGVKLAQNAVAAVAARDTVVLAQRGTVRIAQLVRFPLQAAILRRDARHGSAGLPAQVKQTGPRRGPAVAVDVVLAGTPQDLACRRFDGHRAAGADV